MSLSSPGTDVTRLELVRRIERFLGLLGKEHREPAPVEAAHVLDALRCLNEGQFAEGELAMARAELGQAARTEPPKVFVGYNAVVTAQLLTQAMGADSDEAGHRFRTKAAIASD